LAEQQAAEAFAYIQADRPTAAVRWLDRLLDAVATLAEFPDGGRAIPEVGRPELRELIVRPYRVVYRRDAKQVFILSIRHGRRTFDEHSLSS
jgi:plasmid stabilization system protein ParE